MVFDTLGLRILSSVDLLFLRSQRGGSVGAAKSFQLVSLALIFEFQYAVFFPQLLSVRANLHEFLFADLQRILQFRYLVQLHPALMLRQHLIHLVVRGRIATCVHIVSQPRHLLSFRFQLAVHVRKCGLEFRLDPLRCPPEAGSGTGARNWWLPSCDTHRSLIRCRCCCGRGRGRGRGRG